MQLLYLGNKLLFNKKNAIKFGIYTDSIMLGVNFNTF